MFKRIHRHGGVLKAKLRPAGMDRRAVIALLLAAPLGPGAARAQGLSFDEDIVFDPLTGAAIYGFDPVSYFVRGAAVHGEAEHQLIHAGKVWYFESGANLRAFAAGPDSYLPAYGGHDPVSIAAGFAVAGSPEIFAIVGNRIHLFRKEEARAAFLADPTLAEVAARNWPQVKLDLSP